MEGTQLSKVLRKAIVWAAEVAKVGTVGLPRKQDTMPNLAEAVGEAARTQHRTTLAQAARPYLAQAVAAEEKRTVLTVGLEVFGVPTRQAVAGQVPHQATVEMVRPEVMGAVTVGAEPKSQQETLEGMAVRQVAAVAVLATMVTVAKEPEAKSESLVGR